MLKNWYRIISEASGKVMDRAFDSLKYKTANLLQRVRREFTPEVLQCLQMLMGKCQAAILKIIKHNNNISVLALESKET